MSLDLTKAPWPEFEPATEGRPHSLRTGHIAIRTQEYAFARHRVNLFEALLKEVESIVRGSQNLPAGMQLPPRLQTEMERLEALVAEARK